MSVATAYFDSPLGWLRLRCSNGSLVSVDFLDAAPAIPRPESDACLQQALSWLAAYFAGAPLPLMPPLAPVGTSFQASVWSSLADVAEGEVLTYGALARLLHSAPRAVGGALRANPIPLFIPCHRIVATSGLGGYAGPGDEGKARKRWLLRHEQGLKSGRTSPV